LTASENFATQFYASIRDHNEIPTTAGDGRVPLVSADDIAKVAFEALVDKKSHNTDHIIVGPELLTYDEVSSMSVHFEPVLMEFRLRKYSAKFLDERLLTGSNQKQRS
jgi:hypothetical protein